MSNRHLGNCVDCGHELYHAWLDYGKNHMRQCPECKKYLLKGKMMTEKEIGF